MTFCVAVVTGILFGLVPAIVSAKPELTEALKEGGRGSTGGAHRNRLRNALIVAGNCSRARSADRRRLAREKFCPAAKCFSRI